MVLKLSVMYFCVPMRCFWDMNLCKHRIGAREYLLSGARLSSQSSELHVCTLSYQQSGQNSSPLRPTFLIFRMARLMRLMAYERYHTWVKLHRVTASALPALQCKPSWLQSIWRKPLEQTVLRCSKADRAWSFMNQITSSCPAQGQSTDCKHANSHSHQSAPLWVKTWRNRNILFSVLGLPPHLITNY